MKHLTLLLALVCSEVFAQSDASASLLDTERKRSDAIAAKDFDLAGSLYDDRFQGVTASGKMLDKEGWLTQVRSNNPHILFSTEDVKATIYGNAGVVTGKILSKSKGGTLIGQSRYMLVYLLDNGQWKAVEGQETIMIER